MSSNLMDTEPGGEQTQYEAAVTENQPHKKSTGQLGSTQEQTTEDPSKTRDRQEANADQAQQKAENIRYGQAISEEGMGGKTNVTADEAR